MIEHMKWQRTADGIPTFEEVKGATIMMRMESGETLLRFDMGKFQYENVLPCHDQYIIIDPPEEEPLEYKGKLAAFGGISNGFKVTWSSGDETHIFAADTKAKAVSAWNAFVRSIKEEK